VRARLAERVEAAEALLAAGAAGTGLRPVPVFES